MPETKTCSICKVEQPEENFMIHGEYCRGSFVGRVKRLSWCKECKRACDHAWKVARRKAKKEVSNAIPQ